MSKSFFVLILCFSYFFSGCSCLNRKSKLEVEKFCASIDHNLAKLSRIEDESIGYKCNVYFKQADISKIDVKDPFDTMASVYFYKSKPVLIIEKTQRVEVRGFVTAFDKDGELASSVVFPAVNYIDTLYLYNQNHAKPSAININDYKFLISFLKDKYRLK